ncbi:hypothetical protein RUMCAL_00062 [Ruminococcus callidus ATCC 27760]|uniref:Uncharacterized protein n=1 Tax=Ruminococcus callidus ATCC 27760 TaxID=411473 RepID=U2KG91_9FIRM|nr:hypothetical protein RUMCAL_00062 [Ruminococcus callidus ATCC 27760]
MGSHPFQGRLIPIVLAVTPFCVKIFPDVFDFIASFFKKAETEKPHL